MVPLSTTYVGDADLNFVGRDVYTESGLRLRDEEYLRNTKSVRINNYNVLTLTSPKLNGDILKLSTLKQAKFPTFCSTIKQNLNFIKIADNMRDVQTSTVSDKYTTFEIEILDDMQLQIAYQRKFVRYYLNYNSTSFFFSSEPSFINTKFNYIIDGDTLNLFVNRGVLYAVNIGDNKLIVADPSESIEYRINNYVQNIQPHIDTSWVSYNTHDKNSLHVNPHRSAESLPSNTLVYSNYTNITGNSMLSNFITLKNNHTHKNYSYRSDNTTLEDWNVPNVVSREYTMLCTGVEQEKGAESITLGYEFNNADYVFKADAYTSFVMPDSIYPYSQLNVNDTLLSMNGAMGSNSPYTSDRIFFRDTRPGKSDGQFLCTWLSAANSHSPGVWVDRFYIPEKTSFAAALTSIAYFPYVDPIQQYLNKPLAPSAYHDAPFVYPTLELEFENTPQTHGNALYGETFFDKRSDMLFLPGQEYVYCRMGSKYNTSLMNSFSSRMLVDGFNMKTCKGVDIPVYDAADNVSHVMNNDSFALLQNVKKINDTNQFTMSMWIDCDDWSDYIGHELVGNHNDRGFGVYGDQRVTPIIMVPNGRQVIFLNTDFDLIDSVQLSQTSIDDVIDVRKVSTGVYNTVTTHITGYYVKDIHRNDHLDYFSPIISVFRETLTGIEINDVVYNINLQQCGLLLEDSITTPPILVDNLISTANESVTGIQLEPCKYSNKVIIKSNT